jgi:tetratricopeptide (TPR) repeat protein
MAGLSLILLPALVAAGVAPVDAVRAWEATEEIPTYEEGPPDVNPPFDLFSSIRFNYPYTLRESLTDRRVMRTWRTLNLENAHLRLTVLPDLGGRVWRCVDKANGAQMFYANPSLKFAQVAYRGIWASFGIEFNFPVSHNWVTSSPVDFATARNPDGSASIWVGNIDLPYGMQWRVKLTLRPGRSFLEHTTTLYNRSDVRKRFYWWTNAAVEAWDDSQILYPMPFTASHGFTEIETWPVDSHGVDLSRPGNHRHGPVSLFSHGDREPFMGVYSPRTRAGVVHYASPAELPAKKAWSWGSDADGRDWRKALSDNDSAEIEVQAGLFRNQETYAFLEPQESIRFTEHWLPVREIGGFVRATPDAVLNLERVKGAQGRDRLAVGLNVTRSVAGGRLKLRAGERVVADDLFDLEPSGVFRRQYAVPDPQSRYTVELLDRDGTRLVAHTEGSYDVVARSEVKLGPQTAYRVPPPDARSEGDFVEVGKRQELDGKLLVAWDSYADGLRRFPESYELNKAAGRLAIHLKRFDEAVGRLEKARWRLTDDTEVEYYLGCAYAALAQPERARPLWQAAARFRSLRPASLLQLASLAAREGDPRSALQLVEDAVAAAPSALRAGAMEVILLRRSGQRERALERLDHWLREDPTSAALRSEGVKLGREDAALWTHLAGDPQRVIEVALDYMKLGAYDDALELLGREYPSAGVQAEPGLPRPQQHPEVAYYRGYCREKLGGSPLADFAAASRLSTTYVFPNRAESLPVLRRAVELSPGDATARFLLGSLYLSGGMREPALAQWEEARRLNPRLPVLHRNMGLTLIVRDEYEKAREVLSEGMSADPTNVQVYLALDQVLGLLGRPAEERVHALESFPDPAALPPALVFKLVLARVESGQFEEAERLFAGRFFPREEFGTNVRQVWIEEKTQKALVLARRGRYDEARAAVRTLGDAVPGLAFTRDGLTPFVEGARTQLLIGEVLARAGDETAARTHWEKAAAGEDAYPYPNVVFALEAAHRLRKASDETERRRVEAALESWVNRLAIGTSYPGANALGQALMLRALGREPEAVAKLREALLLPDRIMSHYLARQALR